MSKSTMTRIRPETDAEIARIAHLLGLPAHRSRSAVIAMAVKAMHEKLEARQPEREIDAEAFKLLLGKDTQVVIEVDQDGYPKVDRGALEYRDHVPFVRRYGPLEGATPKFESDGELWTVFLRPTATPLAGFRLKAGTIGATPGSRMVVTVGKMTAHPETQPADEHLSEIKETPDDNR